MKKTALGLSFFIINSFLYLDLTTSNKHYNLIFKNSTAALENITIYRYKNNEIQYLPKKEYDEPEEDFMLGKDVFFDEHTVFYTLLVTESMFEE